METIDYGIDLGTTNSLIAKYSKGKVEVFKNPVGYKETLPSCVAFRGERIIVGDKAREYIVKDPLNVFSAFKRKMGTSEKYLIPSLMTYYSPIGLSAMVLKELKNFIPEVQKPSSIVITIPASFDTVQCNATKEAGREAGFEEVVLLQEPIAASLAFFNEKMNDAGSLGKWLVYDLGGGTFDIALITIDNDEMRVVDHEGDNFLGGVDLDQMIVTQLILPRLKEITGKGDIDSLINQRNGPYEKLYYILLLKAEEAKKELSINDTAEIEFTFEIEGEAARDIYFEITRVEFEKLIEPKIDYTLAFIQKLFDRNNIAPYEIKNIILIGGSTIIPYVRKRIGESTGIPVNFSADPSTAVAVGAAYYAGAKIKTLPTKLIETPNETAIESDVQLQVAYNKTTKDMEEYVTALFENLPSNCTYRIARADGGYDSGIKNAAIKIGEFVMLKANAVNIFTIKLYDELNTELAIPNAKIEITQGLFSLYGQTLPEDICIEVDDMNNNTTISEVIFARNSILPLKKTMFKELSRTIKKGSTDSLIINILEGNQSVHPSANKVIGVIEINGSMLESDLVFGSDVEITLEISESREISVNAVLTFTNQSFNHIFNPMEKYISISKLREELRTLRNEINRSIEKVLEGDDYEKASFLNDILEVCNALIKDASTLREADMDERKYQLEEQKRRVATQYYNVGLNNSPVYEKKEKIQNMKLHIDQVMNFHNDIPDNIREEYKILLDTNPEIMKSTNHFNLNGFYMKLDKFYSKLVYNVPSMLINHFVYLQGLPASAFTNEKAARKLLDQGEKAMEKTNHNELLAICKKIWAELKDEQTEIEKIKGTGLGS
ncbi:MAG: Hsp70 family protein [bacterium]|nr:Hsp70 family protein [bacterium]